MKGITKRPIRFAPNLVLKSVQETRLSCPLCSELIVVDWIDKLDYPIQHSRSATPDIFWVPMSIPLACKNLDCGHSFHQAVPDMDVESKWTLYGDDAARYINEPLQKYSDLPINFSTMTLVCCHSKKQNKIKNELAKLKIIARPNVDPSSWNLHFTEIWNTNEFFSSKQEKIDFAVKFLKVLKSINGYLKFFNFSNCSRIETIEDRPKIIKRQDEEVFQISLLTTLAILRENKKSIRWVFDNFSDTSDGAKVEGWAEEVFMGLQYTRLFTWLSARSIVDKPEFVTPGSHYLLEIADFISFVIAREFHRSVTGKEIELSSARLGNGFYCGRLENGDYDSCDHIGFPKKRFYGVD